MVEIDPRRHWIVALLVLFLDLAFIVATVVLDKTDPVAPPTGGQTNTSALIGWLGVVGAIVAFGCYGILIKTPAVVKAKVDPMVFTQYYGFATALLSVLIWAVAGSQEGLGVTWSSYCMGLLFGVFWIASQVCAYLGVQILGYAVGPAIWIGITICVSFTWGTLIFGNPVHNLPGALLALALLLIGVVMAAYSSRLSDERQRRLEGGVDGRALQEDAAAACGEAEESAAGAAGAGSALLGLGMSAGCGLFNGSLMVPMTCFQQGCSAIGVRAYEGSILAPLAFLPSLALGVLTVLPLFFAAYFWRTLAAGRLPSFQARIVALPGLLTGIFWGCGNFQAMFATVYLGQTIGFPLTQCCLILNGSWGIMYFKEVKGAQPIGLFVLASLVIIAGAALDGKCG